MLKNMFTPIKIGNIEIKNRFIVAPMATNYCPGDGTASETFIAYHEAKAKGGWGLIIAENCAIDPKGKAYPFIPGLWEDSQIEGYSELTKRVHAHGAKIFTQPYHPGRQASRKTAGVQPVAPTAIPCPVMLDMPRELSIPEIKEIIEKFGDCALRAKKAGFDGVEIHGGHGYLVSQFMSSYANKRFDIYGGNLTNRMRFARELVENIREKCGESFPIQFRISADEAVPGGRTIEETKVIAKMLEDAGVSSLDVSVGVYASWYTQVPPSAIGPGWLSDYAAEIKKVVKIPVFTVGRVNDPLIADSIIESGKADAAIMGRASLADPELPNKAKEGKYEEIITCTACLLGCTTRLDKHLPIRCILNPKTGRENEFAVTPAIHRKKVFIAGGGPAGMEAAIVAAQRGHDVTLFEKGKRLGGQFYLASIPPWKGEISTFLAWQTHAMEKQGVEVKLETELTVDIVSSEKPDAVIIATGSVPAIPNLPGIDREFVIDACALLEGKVNVGKIVAVIGGGMIGSEVTHFLVHHSKKPVIIEALEEVAKEEPNNMKRFLLQVFKDNDVPIYVHSTLKEIHADGTIDVMQNGEIKTLGAFDNVVIAVGMKSVNTLEKKLEKIVDEVYVVGDACSARQALEAIEEGYQAALNV